MLDKIFKLGENKIFPSPNQRTHKRKVASNPGEKGGGANIRTLIYKKLTFKEAEKIGLNQSLIYRIYTTFLHSHSNSLHFSFFTSVIKEKTTLRKNIGGVFAPPLPKQMLHL